MRAAIKLTSSLIKTSSTVLRKPKSIGCNRCVSHFVFSPESPDQSLGM